MYRKKIICINNPIVIFKVYGDQIITEKLHLYNVSNFVRNLEIQEIYYQKQF